MSSPRMSSTEVIFPEEGEAEPYVKPKFDKKAAEQNPVVELANRALAHKHLLPFIQRYRPRYDAGWVHKDICRRLERFVSDVAAKKRPRMLLMMPPRSGKSEIGSRHLPAWVMGHYPDWEIIAASHTSSLSMGFSRYIRDLLVDPSYRDVFPDTELSPTSRALERWQTTEGGSYLAAGVGTGITGRGCNILLLDDLVKDSEAADSRNIRDNTWEWYVSTAYTRLAPGAGVLGIMTPWSDDDWSGRIQQVMEQGDGDQFEIVKYPALNERGDEYLLPDDTIIEVPERQPVPQGAIMTRPHNTALHPARYSTEDVQKMKLNFIATGQKRVWSALYQQNPSPEEGAFFTKDMFRFFTVAPARRGRTVVQAWDFAITEGDQNDWTVGTTLMQDEFSSLYVLDVRRFRSGDGEFIVDEILNYAREYEADVLGFEDGQIWKSLFSTFERRCSERIQFPAYEVLVPLTDKLVRASPLKGRMQLGKVHFCKQSAYWNDLEHEMLRFPAGKHDDQIDSLAWAVRTVLTLAPPRAEDLTPKKPEDWMARLLARGLGAGGGESHMAA